MLLPKYSLSLANYCSPPNFPSLHSTTCIKLLISLPHHIWSFAFQRLHGCLFLCNFSSSKNSFSVSLPLPVFSSVLPSPGTLDFLEKSRDLSHHCELDMENI